MNRALLLALLLLLPAAPLPAAPGKELSARLRQLSVKAFQEAITYEARKSPLARKALPPVWPTGAPDGSENMTQAGLFDAAAGLLRMSGLEPQARAAAEKAVSEARAYLAPENLPAWEEKNPPATRTPPPDLALHEGGCPEVAAADPAALRWKDADGYASSRLGPLRALLDDLGPGDRIILSNLPPERLPGSLFGGGELLALHLPISGYAKSLWLLTGADGARTLLLGDFQGAAFLRHFELLLRRYYSGKKAPRLAAAESPSAYEPHYQALTRLRAANPGKLDNLEGLIAGYAESFRLYWSSWSVTSASDSEGDWKVDIYKPAGGSQWGVISARSSYYGETLGMNIRYLVEASTGIKSVVIAGSGGSLAPAPLYSVTYPSHILTAGGQAEPNALASLADYTAHVSVVSPMEETPAWLAGALGQGAATVDVEMAPAADALRGLGLRLGFAVLVTDFPADRPVFSKALKQASLASQDAAAKYQGLGEYARGLEEWIRGGPPQGWQPIEKKLGRSLADQSALNLAAEEKRLAPLSADEEKAVKKLEAYFSVEPPSFSVRMSTARAANVLQDEALLSTGLVTALKGEETNPFTPGYEQRSYGAYDYIFGTLSYWDGPEKYGPAVLRLRQKTWQRRAWATRRSAMRALAIEAERRGLTMQEAEASAAAVKSAEALFASWIVVPRDLPRALALQVAGELRGLPAGALADFLKARVRDIPALIERYDVGWLEGKIRGAAQPEDIELIKAQPPLPEGIAGPAARLGIKTLAGD